MKPDTEYGYFQDQQIVLFQIKTGPNFVTVIKIKYTGPAYKKSILIHTNVLVTNGAWNVACP